MTTSRPTTKDFVAGSWRKPRTRHTVLLRMAKDAEKLDAQAERLRALKDQARGVTFRKIADAVGVTERQVQRWFAGDSDIDGDNIDRLAAFLGTSADYIEYGTMRRATPDLFAADGSDRLKAIEERLADIEANQRALLAAMQELGRQLTRRPPARRSQAS
jgi:transcriptional regulator with XRE-family HTH domain